MNLIYLIRNKWFILVSSTILCAIFVLTFQYVYKNDIFLIRMYKSKDPDSLKIINLYEEWMKSKPKREEIGQYFRLSEILTKIDKKGEAIKILKKLLKTFPEDRNVRLWLAVELHNQQRYIEAEEHFMLLLMEETIK